MKKKHSTIQALKSKVITTLEKQSERKKLFASVSKYSGEHGQTSSVSGDVMQVPESHFNRSRDLFAFIICFISLIISVFFRFQNSNGENCYFQKSNESAKANVFDR